MSFWSPLSLRNDLPSQRQLKPNRDDLTQRLARSRELIMSCYDEPLDLETLAAQSCYSPYHFHRVFLERYGVTPHQMLHARRMQRAAHLLQHSSLSITEICLEVGFSSLGSFSSAFRRHFGQSPRAFQRRIYQPGWDPRSQFPSCLYAFWRKT